MQKVQPFLWFDNQAEDAANFYVSLFPDSKIDNLSRYPEGSPGPAGQVMVVSFSIFGGQQFTALNGGPVYTISPGVSFVINCETQEEVDKYWNALGDGGQPNQCGWVSDRFGVTWQVVPTALGHYLSSGTPAQSQAVMQAMLQMTKLEIAPLKAAFESA
jgi:predicted 3-demethylubiquinone-9 3-methyltransferase (glyoxalase superfamily)